MSKTYKLIPLIDLDRTVQLRVLGIRNEEFVREWMFTENAITEDEHLTWIERLKTERDQICFVIIDDDTCPFGAVNLKKIDKNHKTAEIGFYKTQNLNVNGGGGRGLMTGSLSALIDYSFNALGLEKIYSEVFEGNVKSLNIHKKLLFTEEGFLRSHIIMGGGGGERIGVHLFGLLKKEWLIGREKINIGNDIIISPVE